MTYIGLFGALGSGFQCGLHSSSPRPGGGEFAMGKWGSPHITWTVKYGDPELGSHT